MNPVAELLADMIRRYPCLVANRTQALHDALIVAGNGLEWRDGLLASRVPDSRSCRESHMQRRLTPKETELYAAAGLELSETRRTGICAAEHLRAEAPQLALAQGPLDRTPYPPSPGLLIFEIPDNAHEAWHKAAREIAATVGPLWLNPAADELAHENRYMEAQRAAGISLLRERFPSCAG
ncbi:hypothetical protein [Streptomyces sp. NBC_01601]|uniref:hypothetical protein n=1 Tax=Streptomyces sp. NBC_01601 TaxID=2975892 RepID=UPI002E29ECD6|nr:hypothetical protein [Streptomyces sp. NBC_01601]